MKTIKNLLCIATLLFTTNILLFAQAQNSQTKNKQNKQKKPQADEVISYKKIGDIDLKLHVFYPKNHAKSDKKPCMVFFHGGGWNGGSPKHFFRQSGYLASRGIVALSVEYRIKKEHGTSPQECVKDAKSAMRWVKTNAARLGIDPEKILAGGGSAGGHLAAAVATLSKFDDETDDTSISCVPKALVLFNPVINCAPGSKPHKRVADYWQDFSPLHNVSETTPPTIVFQGTADELVNYKDIEEFQKAMESKGRRCDIRLYKDQPHSFFNKTKYNETVYEMDKFLISLGYLDGEPTIELPDEKDVVEKK